MIIINTLDEYKNIINNNSLILIYCGLTTCPPCKIVFPKFEKIVANSHPITPAPRITRLSGNSFNELIPSLVIITFSSKGIVSSFRGRLPVAIMIFSANTFWLPESVLTSISLVLSKLALPFK